MCAYGTEPHWGPCEEVARAEREREEWERQDDKERQLSRKRRYYGTTDPKILARLPDRPF